MPVQHLNKTGVSTWQIALAVGDYRDHSQGLTADQEDYRIEIYVP